MAVEARTVRAPDGRTLAVQTWGAPHGAPVFLLHGTPGSLSGPRPRPGRTYLDGIRLITYDRPGYGESTRLPGRSFAHAAADVTAIADGLGVKRFAVLGRSGGGPHALACAALLPDRVTRVATLSGAAPRDAQDLDWYAGMNADNVRLFSAAEHRREELSAILAARAEAMNTDPAAATPFDPSELKQSEQALLTNRSLMLMQMANFSRAFASSSAGWFDDVRAFVSPWGFDPADITVPVHLWHGAGDGFIPVSHSRWLAARIASAVLTVEPSAAHIDGLAAMPGVLRDLARDPGY